MKLAFSNLNAVGEGALKRRMLSSQLQRVWFNGIGKYRLNSGVLKAFQLILMCYNVLTRDELMETSSILISIQPA